MNYKEKFKKLLEDYPDPNDVLFDIVFMDKQMTGQEILESGDDELIEDAHDIFVHCINK